MSTFHASLEHLGRPALRLAGLQLWVHSVSSEDWLSVTAHCGGHSASVAADGEILQLADVARFGDECAELERGVRTNATLQSFEPNLKVALQSIDRLGHIAFRVEITPDHTTQSHSFECEIDRTYLTDVVRSCAAIVTKFSAHENESGHSVPG